MLESENEALKNEMSVLNAAAAKGAEADTQPADLDGEVMSEEALRKRLERVCKRRKDGTLGRFI